MTVPATSPPPVIDLEGLGLDQGGHLLLKRALAGVGVGERVEVRGTAADLAVHVRAWARAQGHGYDWPYGGRGEAGVRPGGEPSRPRVPAVQGSPTGRRRRGGWRPGAPWSRRAGPSSASP